MSACVLAAMALLFAAAPSAAGAAAWNLQPAAVPQVPNGALSAVNCSSSSACTAVGSVTDSAGFQVPLVERWNGTSWRRQTTPSPSGASAARLNSVRCVSTTFCVAVGGYSDDADKRFTIAERWDGTKWSIQTTPNQGADFNELNGVTCTSTTSCVAVGTAATAGPDGGFVFQILAARWNGTSWAPESIPAPEGATDASLTKVSCSSSSACTAVGSFSTGGDRSPFAVRWNGSTWSLQAMPAPTDAENTEPTGVSCPSSTVCVAVGNYAFNGGDSGGRFTARWDGTSWTTEGTPNADDDREQLNAVSCSSPSTCTAVGVAFPGAGGSSTLALRFDGTSWSLQSTPDRDRSSFTELDGVSCANATACIAVGLSRITSASFSSFDSAIYTAPFALSWNGTAWSSQTTPAPAGAADSELRGVRCTTAAACTAVGSVTNGSGSLTALAERWNGTRWSIQATPSPSGATGSLFNDVTCTSSRACTAVGAYSDSTGRQFALAERWNGASWSVQTVPEPPGAIESHLEAVSCSSATACTGVGGFTDASGNELALAVRWNGTTWAVQSSPSPGGAGTHLSGVSCPTATACTAVGANRFTGATLAERWDGTSWSVQATPGGRSSFLRSVSCPAGTACTAVGTIGSGSFAQVPLAERWEGTSWAIQATPSPAGTNDSELSGVTCRTTTVCVAVGFYRDDAASRDLTLAERWNGATWAIEATPNLAGAQSELRKVSCGSAGTCIAVGRGLRAVQVPLVVRFA